MAQFDLILIHAVVHEGSFFVFKYPVGIAPFAKKTSLYALTRLCTFAGKQWMTRVQVCFWIICLGSLPTQLCLCLYQVSESYFYKRPKSKMVDFEGVPVFSLI